MNKTAKRARAFASTEENRMMKKSIAALSMVAIALLYGCASEQIERGEEARWSVGPTDAHFDHSVEVGPVSAIG